MKLCCEIVEDLLPLYGDRVCSEESRKAVEAHLEKCSRCREQAEKNGAISIPVIEPDQPEADKAVKEGLRKIKKRWWLTVIACLVLCSGALILWNHFSGSSLNVFDRAAQTKMANEFMEALAEGDYEKAYSYWNVAYTKLLWSMEWSEKEEFENLESDGLAKFCELGREMDALGGIESFECIGVSQSFAVGYDGVKSGYVNFQVNFAGKEYRVSVSVSENGVDGFTAGQEIMHPLERLGHWSEWLWQDYKGCYWDPESGTYVYYEMENDE